MDVKRDAIADNIVLQYNIRKSRTSETREKEPKLSEKAILLFSPWIVDIPAILPVSTPPNGILCLCGSCDYAIIPLSPWINWNRKVQFCLAVALLDG
ncbi:unnamed protein product [Brassica oleracea var. botrytis]